MRKIELCFHAIEERMTVRQLISLWIMHPTLEEFVCRMCYEMKNE